jgi:hypothetical protein
LISVVAKTLSRIRHSRRYRLKNSGAQGRTNPGW